jgi:hypothetical protein
MCSNKLYVKESNKSGYQSKPHLQLQLSEYNENKAFSAFHMQREA